MTTLHTAGRLPLVNPVDQWIRDALDRPGVRVTELASAVAVDAGRIPRTALADPLDRLLVATARQIGATFLTGDTPILEYASRSGHVRVEDARV